MKLYLCLKNGIPEIEASETPQPGFELYELTKVSEALATLGELPPLPEGNPAPVSQTAAVNDARDRLSRAVEDPAGPNDELHKAAVALLLALNAADAPQQDNPASVSPYPGSPDTKITVPEGLQQEDQKIVQPRTVREWLETLPPGYRERALKNLAMRPSNEWPYPDSRCDDLIHALRIGFRWADTPEGWRFWQQFRGYLQGIKELPELPTT